MGKFLARLSRSLVQRNGNNLPSYKNSFIYYYISYEMRALKRAYTLLIDLNALAGFFSEFQTGKVVGRFTRKRENC